MKNFNQFFNQTIKENMNPSDIVDQLKEMLKGGPSFASFYYKAKQPPKGSGSEGIYNVRLGVSYTNYVKKDLEKLQAYQPKDDVEAEAKTQMEKSMQEHINQGVSSSYTKKGMTTSLGKGISVDNQTEEIYIQGYVRSFQSIKQGIPKKPPVNPVPIAKDKIKKELKFDSAKVRTFILNPQSIAGLKLKGDMIEFQN